jgi:plastocyanin
MYADARMKRLAGIATVYALIAALVLVAPLSAADPAAPPAADEAPPASPPEPASEPVPETAPTPVEATPAPPPTEVAAPETAPPPEAPAEDVDQPSAEPPAVAEARPEPVGDRSRDRAPRATAAADTGVTIRDFEFAPASVTVDVGDTVTWTNDGPTPHSATADDGSFDTGIFGAGQSRSHTFEQAGTFQYFCTPHPNMRGTITVRAASTGGDGSGGGGDTSGEDSGTATDDGTASGDGSGAALPATGLDAGGLAVLGLMTLALGAWLRRRASAAG